MSGIKSHINRLFNVFSFGNNKEFGISEWIRKYLDKKDTQIIQIGSNDGKTTDPLHELIIKNSNWRVIFVEPVPYLFERLTTNYPKSTRFIFDNSAINDGAEQMFYYVNNKAAKELDDLPFWYDQLGSFDKGNIINHLNGKLEPYIEEKELKGITLPDLLNKYSVRSIDLLHIDTEGHDWKVLSQLDLKRYKPKIILFEYKHLNEKEIIKALRFLKRSVLHF